MHGKPAARNTHCSRTTGEEVHVHSLHRQHGVLQRDFAISETGDPQEQVLRRTSSEDYIVTCSVGDLLLLLQQAVRANSTRYRNPFGSWPC